MTDYQYRILVVDDDPDVVKLLEVWLRSLSYMVRSTFSATDALNELETYTPDLVITDLSMPGMDGIELLGRIQDFDASLPVIMISGTAEIPDAVEATRKGVVSFLTKPLKMDSFSESVQNALRIASQSELEEQGTFDFAEGIVYRGHGMLHLLQRVRRAARGNSTVMIEGESGTGKELLAQAIHNASPRREEAFVAINCGALPEQLLESELFGHTKGAFTGATSSRPGLIRAADGGTLFLDEVGDMPLPLQVRLLRVLQEGLVRPVGAVEEFKVDVRVVTATHRDLEQMVSEGDFREDLYYRLNVVPLVVPPLRDRREDIPALADYLLTQIAERFQEPRSRFSPDAMDAMLNASWPGNVRQLANVVEQCVVLTTATVIPKGLVETALRSRQDPVQTLEEAVRDFERGYLIKILTMTEGNVTRAAKVAGRNRTDFYNLLNRHDLDAAAFRVPSSDGE